MLRRTIDPYLIKIGLIAMFNLVLNAIVLLYRTIGCKILYSIKDGTTNCN